MRPSWSRWRWSRRAGAPEPRRRLHWTQVEAEHTVYYTQQEEPGSAQDSFLLKGVFLPLFWGSESGFLESTRARLNIYSYWHCVNKVAFNNNYIVKLPNSLFRLNQKKFWCFFSSSLDSQCSQWPWLSSWTSKRKRKPSFSNERKPSLKAFKGNNEWLPAQS